MMAAVLVTMLSLASCERSAGNGARGDVRYRLVCDSADTAQSSTLFCTRLDTRTGDVRTVDLAKVSVSNGPVGGPEYPPGTYELVCKSTQTPQRADYRCVRLNASTGEILLLNLPKVGVIPAN
jgi:hypothetical protein